MMQRALLALEAPLHDQLAQQAVALARVDVEVLHVLHGGQGLGRAREPEHLGQRGVGVEQPAVGVRAEQADGRVLEQLPVLALGLAQRGLVPHQLGDVHHRALEEQHAPARVEHGARVLRDPDQGAVAAAALGARVLELASACSVACSWRPRSGSTYSAAARSATSLQHVRGRVEAEDARQRRVHVQEAAAGQAAVQALGRRLEQGHGSCPRRSRGSAARRRQGGTSCTRANA
jgi:hypothetical protein